MSQSLISAETGCLAVGNLEERLRAHPHLCERIEALLKVVENSASDVETADLAEERVIEEVRQIGHQALSSWAEHQHQKQIELLRSDRPQVRQHLKKNSTGTPALEPSRYLSSSLPKGKENLALRPFSQSARVACRSYSTPLQRIITDFGADIPFGRIPKKLKEHYGISVPVSSAQKITQDHATQVLKEHQTQTQIPSSKGVSQLIVEMDGSMIPIVETESTTAQNQKIDRRKTRTVGWREARLCLARQTGSSQPIFGVTLGSVDAAGDQLAHSAIRAGVGTDTSVHGVGDGAPWIVNQVNRIFGTEATYLIDFYHLCDYLAA